MRKFFYLSLIWILTCTAVYAQQRQATLRGVVMDGANNSPLIGALVMVDSTRHVTTNTSGQFAVSGLAMKEVEVVITFLGYEPVVRKVNLNKAAVNLGTISMKETGNNIEQVVIHGQSTMAIQKGDTTQFNASAFKTNPDADAGDLVNKMPGLTVEEGSVQAQGESVKRVYVDGKLFYGDDPMSALRNLPADAVESIQMFDELSDEAKFVGFDDGKTSKALNIVTKHKINRSVVGRLEAGYGKELDKSIDNRYQDRYTVGGNVNMFSDKNRWSLNGLTNNVNRNNSGRGGGGGGNAGMRTINNVGLNYSGDWGTKIKFNANYSYNENHTKEQTQRLQDYFPTEQFQSRIYGDTSVSKSNNSGHNGGIRFEFQSAKDRVLFTPTFSYSENDSWRFRQALNLLDGEVTNRTQTTTTSDGNSYNVGGNVYWTHVLNKPGRSITTSANITMSENNSNTWQIDTTEFTTNRTYINTNQNGWNHNIGGRLSYAEPLSQYSRLTVDYRIRYDNSKSDKIAIDQETGEIDEALSNTFTRNYLRNSGGFGYTFRKGNSRLSAGLDYETARLEKDQLFPTDRPPFPSRTFNSWQPSVRFRYELEKSKYLNVNYQGESDLPSIEQLQNVIDNSNILQLKAGNPNLKQSYTHQIRFEYFATNVEKSTSFYSYLNAQFKRNSVANKTQYFTEDTSLPEYNDFIAQKGSQLTTPVNLNGYIAVNAMAGFSFPLNVLKTNINLGGGYGFTRAPSYTGENLNYSNQNQASFRVGFVSNISENVDFDISSNTSFSYASNSAKSDTKYWRENVRANLNVIFLGGFVFNTNFSYNYSNSSAGSGNIQRYCLWNAGIGHKFLKRRTAEFRVTMYDILKQNKSLQHTIGDSYIQDTWSQTIGRYVMATLSFRFNSMNSLSKSSRGGGEGDFERRGQGVPMTPGSRSGFPGGGRGGFPGGGTRH